MDHQMVLKKRNLKKSNQRMKKNLMMPKICPKRRRMTNLL